MPRTYADLPDVPLAESMQRGRDDHEFFAHYFLRRKLHEGQAEWMRNAQATINVLPTGNRYGKTSTLSVMHLHSAFYKIGAEPFYMDGPDAGPWEFDLKRYMETKYYTIHTAGLWDQSKLTWEDCLKIVAESPRLQPFIADMPRTLPPHINFQNGARILFRTLGDVGENIDGHSFYLVTIDEAGWITNLEYILMNVARLRVADVRGRIAIVGTMKPGISRDFYRYARRAAISTGRKVIFDHRDGRNYAAERKAALDV